MSRNRAATKGLSTASRPRRRPVEGKRHHGKRSQPDSEKRLKHPAFPQPRRTRRAVWHYMTLAKFIALLDSRALFFCRLDRLGDDYEGRLPGHWHGDFGPGKEPAQIRRLRTSCYVNCWNMSNDENEALWRRVSRLDPLFSRSRGSHHGRPRLRHA
jgi:hypothetical protein